MTCSVIRQAVQRDFMRHLGDGHLAIDLGSIARDTSPFNRDFAIVDGDQPVDVDVDLDWSRNVDRTRHTLICVDQVPRPHLATR